MRREKRPSSRAVKIAFLGGGRMAEALISGLIGSKKARPSDITASDVQEIRRSQLKDIYKINTTGDNQAAADTASIIVLAVKPQVMGQAVKGLNVKSDKLIVSIAAGIPIPFLESVFPGNPVVRVMPNNPAMVKAGISALAYGSRVKEEDKEKAKKIFRSVGEVVEVDEALMDAVTGLSGSGPAFIYLMVEAMAEAGENLGIARETAHKLAVETLLGAAQTLKRTKKHPRELIDMVSSPGGTTLRGLEVMERKDFKSAVIDAIVASRNRAKELSSEWT
ncbi:MAG TPA: pyrroline-5-carboxylate reductase [Candidatus Omnitrophota bacterium]|nr:pyrroline-5-carboxylate reductase [Candidatus Omnitrophota bacterium]